MGKIGHIATHRALIDYCRHMQVDTDRLIRAAGLDPQVFVDPDGTIDEAGRRALWTHAYTMTGDANLALHVPMFRTFAESDGLAATAPTVGAAFEDQTDFWNWFDRSSLFSIERVADEVAITLQMADGSQVSRVRAQYGFADLYIGICKVTRRSFVPLRVEFSSSEPRDTSVLKDLFRQCPLAFGQPKDRLWLRSEDFFQEVGHDHHYRRKPQLSVFSLRAQDSSSVAAAVRSILQERIGNEPISLYRTARRIGMSARTLQRRLAAEGVSFAEVVDHARKSLACTLLQGKTHSIAGITFLVGFSEQSAFTRAFRRWTGVTPARYRRGLRTSLPAGSEHGAERAPS